jgi:UDP-3-O-[3-hydroxymyristoyl] glucosamine N-acyltransferase
LTTLSLQEVAEAVNGTVEGLDGDASKALITGVNSLGDAGIGEITFLANKRYKNGLSGTCATAVLLAAGDPAPEQCAVVRVADPYLAFALLQRLYFPPPRADGARHASAVIDSTAILAADVSVAAHAVIGAHAQIGAGSIIGAGCIVGEGARIGDFCLMHANAVVASGCVLGDHVILQSGAVIGSDGFGYAWSGSEHLKIPQVGRVILESDVEIGANTCIDRGAIGDTVIERGVKLDNQIQIAHNVRIGAYSIMASQVGISGSTKIGAGCQFGGQAGLAGHLNVGDGCRLAAQSGVMADLEAGGVYAGSPAMPHRLWLRVSALMSKLPELWKLRHKHDQ